MSERTRLHYPTVYVVHTEDKNRYKSVPDYTVYVGGDEGRRGARPRRERHDQDGGHGEVRDREHRAVGTLVPRVPGGRPGGAQAEAQGQAQRLEIQTEARTHARAGARRTGRLSEGEGRVPGKTPGPAGVQVTRRERSAVRAPWR